MIRKTLKLLNNWYQSDSRKPLIIQGARQVGKTFLMKQFAEQAQLRQHYINFEESSKFNVIFAEDFDVERILNDLSFILGAKIDRDHDLLIFDEIQSCPRALTCLKYFCERVPQLAIVCAGSLLGITLSSEPFPVGKVDLLKLYPLDFSEFLSGIGDEPALAAMKELELGSPVSEVIHEHLLGRYRLFTFIGGMPEAVLAGRKVLESPFAALEKVRRVQHALIKGYIADFAKHSGKVNSVHIAGVFEDIPRQLANFHDVGVSRFRFKDVLPNKKSWSELSGPIAWLVNADLVITSSLCKKAVHPLESYTQDNQFKLFIFDIGILGAMLEIPYSRIQSGSFGSYKGFYTENYVCQMLKSLDIYGEISLYTWSEGRAELEFLYLDRGNIIPIEVKSGTSTRAKSFQSFKQRYDPDFGIKISANRVGFDQINRILSLPLYLVHALPKLIDAYVRAK